MKIRILSDLHLEFGSVEIPYVDCDCVVLAGDIHTKRNALPWIVANFPSVPVVYILGNHEFYGERLPRLTEKMQEQTRGGNIHVLENSHITIQGVSIFGCTLWTDMALHGDHILGCMEANSQMNDYKRVRNSARGYKKLTAGDTRNVHLKSVQEMRRFMEGPNGAAVVVTHHAPSPISLPERRRVEPISCAYASRLESLIEEAGPAVWIHGHIHHSNDYYIGNTRIVANPRGYPDHANRSFVPDLVIEI